MTHLHISVPAINRGTLARTHELKKKNTKRKSISQKRLSNLVNRLLKYLPRSTEKKDEMANRSQKQVKSCEQADARAAFFFL